MNYREIYTPRQLLKGQRMNGGSKFFEISHWWSESHASGIHIPGRIVLNLWRLLRYGFSFVLLPSFSSELVLNIYTFENVVYHTLHRRFTSLFFFRDLQNSLLFLPKTSGMVWMQGWSSLPFQNSSNNLLSPAYTTYSGSSIQTRYYLTNQVYLLIHQIWSSVNLPERLESIFSRS